MLTIPCPSARGIGQQKSHRNGGGSGRIALNVGSETRWAIQTEHGLELKAEAGQNKV